LGRNDFTRLPPALLAATRLRTLSLLGCCELALSVHDADALLEAMPQLERLCLGSSRQELQRTPDAVLQYWQHRLGPRLQPLVWDAANEDIGVSGGGIV
jgi:hypothetical protein